MSMRSRRRRRRLPSSAARRCSGRPFCGHCTRTGPLQPALGRDHQALRIGVERLGDQLFADVRPVRVRRIDQVDAQLERPPQHRQRFRVVRRWSPDALAGDAHRAEAQPIDRQVAADGELPGRFRRHEPPSGLPAADILRVLSVLACSFLYSSPANRGQHYEKRRKVLLAEPQGRARRTIARS